MQKIVPFLWFDSAAEDAASLYVEAFSAIGSPETALGTVARYGKEGFEIHGQPEGKAMTVDFTLGGFRVNALNGGPIFKPNPSISFMVNFDPSRDHDAKAHLDTLWEKLSPGGKVLMPLGAYPFSKHYGWVEDRYGVSWQLMLTNPEGEVRPFIIPSMLFVGNVAGKAEEAGALYRSVFGNSKEGNKARYPKGMEPEKEGTLMFSDFMLEGQWFVAMDSSRKHEFAFSEGFSFLVNVETQEELDHIWNALSAVPASEQCGWLKDTFGVSWQIVPTVLGRLMSDTDKAKSGRVMQAMLQMKKIDIAGLEKAFAAT